jgi:hypothetical protein
MTILLRKGGPLTRRRFLIGFASTGAMGAGIGKTFIRRAADRTMITHGVQSGDVSIDSGVVWARADLFGHVAIDGATEIMTVTLKDVDNRALWSVPIEPRLAMVGQAVLGGRLRISQ